jgi:hypothetical protein
MLDSAKDTVLAFTIQPTGHCMSYLHKFILYTFTCTGICLPVRKLYIGAEKLNAYNDNDRSAHTLALLKHAENARNDAVNRNQRTTR